MRKNVFQISFKNTSKDHKLWLASQDLEEKSVTIKEILYKELVIKQSHLEDKHV